MKARGMLWLALAVMAVAQCLPWEQVRVYQPLYSPFQRARARSFYLQISVLYDVEFLSVFETPLPDTYPTLYSIGMFEGRRVVGGDMPRTVALNQAAELWRCRGLFKWRLPHARHMGLTWSAEILALMAIGFWSLTAAGMVAMPFLTTWLGRIRPMLWVARFLAGSMLVWLMEHLVRVRVLTGSPGLDHVGPGYWLSLVALGIEITGLFLIAAPLTEERRGQTLIPKH